MSYLIFLEHDVGVYKRLLELDPVVAEVVEHLLHAVLDRHLVLLHDGELVVQRLELGLYLRLVGIELLPQGQAVTKLLQCLWGLTHPVNTPQVILISALNNHHFRP